MEEPYQIHPYNINELIRVFSASPETSHEKVISKLQIVYFEEYFTALEAKTFIVEQEYIDHDFLEDFSNYYVKCFKKYNKEMQPSSFF